MTASEGVESVTPTPRDLRRFAVLSLPSLAALDLVLLAAASSGPDLIRASDAIMPMAVSAVAVATSLAIGRVLARGGLQVSLIATLLVLAFGTFGDVTNGLRQGGTLDFLGGEAGLAVLFFLGLAGPVLAIARGHRSLPEWARYARVVLVVLGALAGFRIIRAAWMPLPPAIDSGIVATKAPPNRPPDIWLLLMDKYTSTEQLERLYGFDNRPFEAWLRSRGFVLPSGQHTNYPQTFLVLASMLNLRYLDDYTARFGGQTRLAAIPDIENNRLVAFLKEHGYRFVFSPSAFDVARRNRYADQQLPDPADVRPELSVRWERATALTSLRKLACLALGCTITVPPYVPESVEAQEAKLAGLAHLAPDRPTFVFAHILLPHEPYIYHADCSRRQPYWPETDWGADEAPQREAYLEQVECTNRKLQQLVQSILRNAAVPPIILIQSDHGHGRLGRPVPPLGWGPPERVEERLSPFAAYLLPGLPPDSLYPGITPVNVMRLVLRHYFGAELPRLEDRTYWAETGRPYDFTRLR